MTVTLQIASLNIAQGYPNFNIFRGLTNSGDENITDVRLKVVDIGTPSVFSSLKVDAGGFHTCHNVFASNEIKNWTDGGYNFPAGTTKSIRLFGTVRSDAPIQDNPLVCYWQYIAY